MNTKETIICRDCGREVPREQAFHYRDEYVCPDCAGNNYFFCIGCHNLEELDDMVAINPGTNNEVFVCSNCANSYRVCTHCHRHFDDGYFWMSDGSRSVCNHCSDNYYVCDDCGAIVPEDEVYQVGEDYYCENCYSNHRYEEYIHEYCTMLYKAGVDLKTAQELLGHSSINVTLDIYTHLDAKIREINTYKINEYVSRLTD